MCVVGGVHVCGGRCACVWWEVCMCVVGGVHVWWKVCMCGGRCACVHMGWCVVEEVEPKLWMHRSVVHAPAQHTHTYQHQ